MADFNYSLMESIFSSVYTKARVHTISMAHTFLTLVYCNIISVVQRRFYKVEWSIDQHSCTLNPHLFSSDLASMTNVAFSKVVLYHSHLFSLPCCPRSINCSLRNHPQQAYNYKNRLDSITANSMIRTLS